MPSVEMPAIGGKWVAPKTTTPIFDPLGEATASADKSWGTPLSAKDAKAAELAQNSKIERDDKRLMLSSAASTQRLVVWPPPAPKAPVAQPNPMPFVPVGGTPLAQSGLYQSLAMMRQNMEVLMNQAATMAGGPGNASPG